MIVFAQTFENIIVDDCIRLISLKITFLPGAESKGSKAFRKQNECYSSYSKILKRFFAEF